MNYLKRINKPYLIFLIWNVLMIGAVRGLTFQHEPGRGVSGNGNLGLLVLAPSLLTFLILCIWTTNLSKWWLYDQRQRWGGKIHACVPFAALLLCVLSVAWELHTINNLRLQLNGFTNDPDSAVYRFGWLNQYTNTLFYNVPILLFGLSFSIFISWLMEWKLRSPRST
ncbi:hypothetical protein MHB85_05025 [Paenibacillus sp. FSL K6-4396]|uniref:hypothetical protein n=1 Tax=unclassified Paenibacillus TaxID=185978 RepID=UPI00177F0B46|nr:hypothetical protein [Paenibacillus sp. CFBP 13594]MBD8838462.1 hypothetical protein [Paenibacillus sp. CFBP 13594]